MSQLIAPEPDIKQLSTQLSAEDVQLFYQIGLKGLQEMGLAPTLAIGFEMIALRMYTFRPAAPAEKPTLAYQVKTAEAHKVIAPIPEKIIEKPRTPAPPIQETPVRANISPVLVEPVVSTTTTIDNKPMPTETSWNAILPKIKLSGLAQNAAENAEFVSKADKVITLGAEKNHQSVFTNAVLKRIEDALSNYYGETIKLTMQYREQVQQSVAQQKKEAILKTQKIMLIIKGLI